MRKKNEKKKNETNKKNDEITVIYRSTR